MPGFGHHLDNALRDVFEECFHSRAAAFDQFFEFLIVFRLDDT